MAGKREVKVLITGDASKLTTELGKVEGRIKGMSGVMKGALAGVGFAAITRGVMGAATEFQNMATAANDFATASGLSVEQASRWQEVAGDLGVDASKIEGAFNKISKGLGADREKWKKYGIEVATTEDGLVDVNKTFLRAVDVLHDLDDPLERAKLGSELFGKSWADLAPLVEMSADQLTESLNDVGDAQVIDEKEVEKAKRFRESMDNLNDSTMGLKLTLVEALLPALTGLSGWLGTLDPQMAAVGVSILGVVFVVGKLGSAITGVTGLMSVLAAHPVIAGAGLALVGLALIIKNWDSISAAIGRAIAQVDAFMAKISGPFAGAYQKINNVLGGNFGGGTTSLTPLANQILNRRALGGPVSANTPYIVGEQRPELFVPRTAGSILPSVPAGGGGDVFNIYPSPGMDETDLARKVQRAKDRSSRGLGYAA